jgi:outer membrane protein assembly factor BamB
MIATPTILYLADEKSCKLIDAATGKLQREIIPPASVTGGTFWKWMALEGGVLYALIGPAEVPDPVARWGSQRHGWPWTGISKGYNTEQYQWGFATTLLAIDPNTGEVLWTHQEDPPIDSRSLCMKGGRIYFCSFGQYLACVDAKNGKAIWKRTAEKDGDLFEAIGPYRPGHGFIEGWKSTVYLKCTDKALYFVGPQVGRLTAVSAEDGHLLWQYRVKDLQALIRDDGLYTIGPQNSKDNVTKKLDPLTGDVLASYATRRRACTRTTGAADCIFFRGHEGTGRLDPESGAMQWVSTMRPSCHVGVLIADGHLYWMPWACDCSLQMFGAISWGPAGDFAFDREATEQERLETAGGPAEVARFPSSPGDWPTYRADKARLARTEAAIPEQVSMIWQLPGRPGIEPTAPVAAGGMVFVAGGDGIVRAVDAATGQPRWTAYVGGTVRFPPTIADGRALVGSSDGWVYAFEAATGRLLWRFRAAPAERRIPVYEALLSTWPVASGVLVDGGTAYFAAGITDYDGTHLYAVDTATGKIRWQNNKAGHLDPVSRRGVACQGELLLNQGTLYIAGGNSVGPAAFDAATGKCLTSPPAGQGGAAPRGRELNLVNGKVAVSGQPLYSKPGFPVFDPTAEWTDPVVVAKNAKLSFVRGKGDGGPAWMVRAQRLADGTELWSQPLAAEPVRWGIAVDAQGRVIVALRNGQVRCLGKRGSL